MHHYLEGPSTPNPFADEHARTHPGRVPWLHRLEPGEKENIDTKEEVVWGRAMSARREEFLKRLMAGGDEKRGKEKPTAGNGTGSASGAATPTSAVVESISASTSVREPTRDRDRERERERERGEHEREREKEKEKENQRERGRGEERVREGERERLRHRAVLPNGEREKPFLHYVPPKREERHRGAPRLLIFAAIFLTCYYLRWSCRLSPDTPAPRAQPAQQRAQRQRASSVATAA